MTKYMLDTNICIAVMKGRSAVRAFLEQQGRIIGANDLLIAAHARYLNTVLITNNTREFERIPDLQIEDWIS
jgi:tRNA(fMet)-specific endonuclease VapC